MAIGSTTLPSDFDIFRPCASSAMPWVSTALYGATPRVPQLSSSDDWNQPRCWSEPFDVEVGARCRRRSAPSTTKAWVEPLSNQTSRMSSIALIVRRVAAVAEEDRRVGRPPRVGPARFDRGDDARIDRGVAQIVAGPPVDEQRDRHAPCALAADDPVGPARRPSR